MRPDRFLVSRRNVRVSDGDLQIPFVPTSTDRGRHATCSDRITSGLLASAVLHLLVMLLLVFGLPWLTQAPPQAVRIVPVDLVYLAEKTASPSSPQTAPLPQERAKEISKSESADAVPVPQTPPPQAAERQAEERSTPDLRTVINRAQKPHVPRPVKASRPDASPAAKKRREPLPTDNLSTRLQLLAQLRQPRPPMQSNPRQQEGPGASNVSATSANAARARDATYSVKDFIRAQVEQRWNLDVNLPKNNAWIVAIHIVLNPDGSVSRAEVVETPRYRSDSTYRDFALSARNAVLLSSPLTVPPGEYDIAKDIVLDFSSKQVQQ